MYNMSFVVSPRISEDSDFAGQETESNADVYYACNSPRYIFLSLPQDITGIEKRVLLKLDNLGVNLSNSTSSLLITFLENMTQVHVSIRLNLYLS